MAWWTSRRQAGLALGLGLRDYILRQQPIERKVGVGRERERKRETGKGVGFREFKAHPSCMLSPIRPHLPIHLKKFWLKNKHSNM